MFTGIVSDLGKIKAIRTLKGGLELDIAVDFAATCHIDESIAVDGVCQTVVGFNAEYFTVQAVEETLRKTTFGLYKVGQNVNLERSLTLQKGIEGHLVQGHVDTTAKINSIKEEGANWLVEIAYPASFSNLIVGRGSIAIDGISLTVAREENNLFTVAIIPYTWEHTTLINKKVGDAINLEFDMLGKYVTKYLDNLTNKGADTNGLSKEDLLRMGY